jgi:hypothetical protein
MMTPFIVQHLAQHCPNLVYLDLSWSLFVSTTLLLDPEVLPKLQILKVEKVFLVSEWFMKVSALKKSRPKGVVQLNFFNVLNLVIFLVFIYTDCTDYNMVCIMLFIVFIWCF